MSQSLKPSECQMMSQLENSTFGLVSKLDCIQNTGALETLHKVIFRLSVKLYMKQMNFVFTLGSHSLEVSSYICKHLKISKSEIHLLTSISDKMCTTWIRLGYQIPTRWTQLCHPKPHIELSPVPGGEYEFRQVLPLHLRQS